MSLQGTLKTLGITEVLEFLAARNATGQLDVSTEMGTATYLFSEGEVAQSEYSFIREVGTDSAEATYYVVSELDGTFFFDEDEEPIDIDNCEPVNSVLGRTAEIAEKWLDVEEVIPTPNHLLVRNNALDGSVTIQPEWWKALEVIGSGKTSLEVASQLDMGVLDASLLVLAMTSAGLLNVEQLDPLEITMAPPAEGISQTPGSADAVGAPPIPETALVEEVVPEPILEVESLSIADAPAPVAPTAEVVEPEAPVAPVAQAAVVAEVHVPPAVPEAVPMAPAIPPVAEAFPETLLEPAVQAAPAQEPVEPAPVAAFEPEPAVFEPAPVAEPQSIVESFEPVHQAPAVDPVPAPMEMQHIIEPVVEESFTAAPPVPPVAEPVVDENDGWASNHSPAFEEPAPFQQLAPTPQPEVAPQNNAQVFADNPVEHAPAMDPAAAPAVAHAPAEQPAFDPTGLDAGLDHAALDHNALDHNAHNTAMAGEVLQDLETLSGQIGETGSAEPNWQLDGTFVAEDAAPVAQVDNDPFGDLGDLLSDTDEEDRGSVLKFLRRD